MDDKKPYQIGQVIRILDKTTLIVNAGKSTLSVDDTIQIYELGDSINDLDGTLLGYFTYIKCELNVVQVEDHYSICKTKFTTKTMSSAFALSPLLERTVKEYSLLPIDENEIRPIGSFDTKVHVGDLVKLA